MTSVLNIAIGIVLMGVLSWACWAILNAGGALIKRIGLAQPDAVEQRPIDHEQQGELDAKLAARRTEWDLHGRAAADERFWRSVGLTVAEAEAKKKLLRSEAQISVSAISAVIPDVPTSTKSFVYLIASSAGPFKIGKANDVERRLAELQTSSPWKLRLIAHRRVSSSTDALSAESRIHNKLAGYRLEGEWFSCDLETAKAAMDSVLPE